MNSPLSMLAGEARHEAIIRKSRFLALAAPVDTPGAALDFLARVATPDATHNCWAYRIGQAYRFNDDGEPGGTAGRPIFAAIDGQLFDRVMVVVTRWYGGTRLGAGGLVRAYGGTAAECLRTAARQPIVAWHAIEVDVEFALEAPLRALVDELGGDTAEPRYGSAGMTLPIRIPGSRTAELRRRLTDLSRGRATIRNVAP